jgi:hypothetical protein
MRRMASERSSREALMAGGASPPRKSSSANTSFLDEIDDPHGDYVRMGKSESSSYSPIGYTKGEIKQIKALAWKIDLVHEEHASIDECAPNEDNDAEKRGTCRYAAEKKKRSYNNRKAKKEKSQRIKESHLPVEAKDDEAFEAKAGQMIPKYAVGDKVRFEGELDDDGDTTWIYGIIKEVIHPGDTRNPLENLTMMYLMDQMDGDGTITEAYAAENSITDEEVRWPRKKRGKTVLTISLFNALHDLDRVGIDTCSAVAVSTEREDFLFIDDSPEAKDSVTLRGVGENPVIGGRGPMVVKTLDRQGNEVLIFDPSAKPKLASESLDRLG